MSADLPKIAILDDYQGVALDMADWSALDGRALITVFNDHLSDEDAVADRLWPFDVLCIMRERTPLPRTMIERLPNLRLIVSTGSRNASIDSDAARDRGIAVMHSGYSSKPTIEMTWAMILASVRNIAAENANLRKGGWQRSIGEDLHGRTLAVLGLGNIGSEVARIGRAFGMDVIAWSQNLTAEKARDAQVALVARDELFKRADILSIHLVLSARTRGLVGIDELALMKPTARLINSSRGPIVDEAALIAALSEKRLAAAAIDVFDVEPLPGGHRFRTLENVLATPHIGYVGRSLYETFYKDSVANVVRWLDERS